jgi:hypothetical protein
MSQTVKFLDVRPSAGQNQPDNQIDANLRAYCAKLKRLEPTWMVFTGNADEDIARLHQCAVTKGSQVDVSTLNFTVNWSPRFHTVNANNSGVWDANTINFMGVLYDVTLANGIVQSLCVANL